MDSTATVEVIVQLAAPPLLAQRSGKASLANQQATFRSALAAAVPSAVHRRSFEAAFNGLALTVPREATTTLATLPYVAKVHPDLLVTHGGWTEDSTPTAYDNDTNRIIGADQVHLLHQLTGTGVTIAIIDSGVDYRHPDLGGGFGPSYRVIGGYDFVNDDADPMDDDGHGTHVAGIAAGNGPFLMGVAPNANLLAYKVLDAEGFGQQSGILAGIERALDPDQDPKTDDAADVINLSLGGLGPIPFK